MTCVGSGYEFAHSDDYDRTAPEMPEATAVSPPTSAAPASRHAAAIPSTTRAAEAPRRG